ncbi:MFS transporter [Actinoplanes sp. NPDC051411]|uniref:MFS transporter n=1 Tax=Actinoplanes sp. NPDC051411 TaxID=3155522 RepID=UPI00341D3DDC
MSFTSWRDVYLAAGSRGVSTCGDFLAATSLALVLQQRGHAGIAVSGLLIAAALPVAVLAPLAGRLADRADSRTLLVVAGLLQAVVAAVLAFTSRPIAMIGLVALLACGLAVTQPTLAALTPAMVRPEDLPRASGLGQVASSIGALAGPALAGLLIGTAGPRPALLLDAVSYLALVAAALLIRTRRRPHPSASSPVVPWRLRDDRTLTTLFVALFVVIAGVSAINVFEIFFVRDTLGGSATVWGLLVAAWTAGALIGSALVSRVPKRYFTGPVAVALMAALCLPIVIAGSVDNAGWLFPLWIAGGTCNGVLNVMCAVILAERVVPGARGQAYGVMNAVAQTANMLGFMVAGPLVDHFGPRLLVAACGAAGLLAALACLPMVRSAVRLAPPLAPVLGETGRAGASVEG